MMQDIYKVDPIVAQAIAAEEVRQQDGMEFVASENYQSTAVLQAQASVLANKYSE